MSLESEYYAYKNKKKKKTQQNSGSGSLESEYFAAREELGLDEIAPVRKTTTTKSSKNEDVAPVKTEEEDEGFDFFQKGALEDGITVGSISKAILGTAGDVGVGVLKGASKLVGGVIDAGAYGLAGIADAAGNDDYADKIRAMARENVIDDAFEDADDYLDKYSVLGRTSDSIAEGLGQVGAIILTGGAAAGAGLGVVGTTAATTGMMGVSSFGSGVGEAYEMGATDEEAATYGLIKGVVDAGSEMIFGGLGKTVKALGISKGLTSLDDVFAQKLASKITNHTARNFVEFGVKASAEGVEEVLAGIGSAVGKKLTFMEEKELRELIEDENLLEQFVVGAVTSGISQSGIVPGMKSGSLMDSIQNDRDFVSGLSANEQKVIDKVVADRIADSEKDGKKLTNKEKNKVYDEVLNEMEKGYISTDTIEEVLGGDTYKSYKDTIDSEDALQNEFDALNKMKQGDMTGEQIDRRAELKEQLAEIKNADKRNQIQSQLRNEVLGLVKGDRLVESYNERSRRGQAYEADLTKYDANQQKVIQKAVESGILNNTNRTHEFVDMIAKISADKGVLFDFTNNEKLKDSSFAVDGKTVNGFVTKDGVTLNIDSAKSLNSVVGHEITHVLEGTELYTELQNVMVEYAKSKGDYQGRYDALSELYKDIEGADVNAELTADLVGDYLFTDSDFINNLHANNRNVFQKIYDEVKYLCKVATAGSKEARELEKVKRAFEKAYKEGGKAQSDTKYSVSDSTGKELTKEQQEFFKDSKVRDESGNLQVVYHGTRNADFTVFKRNLNFFTDSKEMADSYSPNGAMYEGYLDIKKPYEVDAEGEKWSRIPIDDEMRTFLEESGGSVFFEDGMWRTTPADIASAIEEAVDNGDMDYDGIIIRNIDDTGSYYKDEGSHVATDYIVFKSNQFKNADNKKPTSDPDIRFSLSKPVEQNKDLMALHNLKSNELLKTLDLGGLPMPSIAIVKADAGHEQYGDVSLILPKETIDPKANKDNKVYGGDAWTPTYPKIEYKPNDAVEQKISDKYYELAKKIGYDEVRPLYSYVNELEDMLNREGGEAAMLERLYEDTGMMQVYLQDSGKGKVQSVVHETVSKISEAEAEMNQFLIDALGEEMVVSFKAAPGENPMKHRKEFMEQHESEILDAYKRLCMEQYGFTEAETQNVLDNTTQRDLMRFMRDAYMFTQNKGVSVKTETDYEATREAIRNAASDGYKEWVDGLFKGVEGKSGIYNGSDYFTRSGNRRSWDALHWENTLENVVKAMRKQNATGADAIFAAHQIFATSAKEYGSIADIKADSDRLKKVSEEEYEAIKESYENRFSAIANRIKDKSHHNEFIARENAMEAIVDAVRNSKTKAGIAKELNEYTNLTVTEADIDDIVSLVSDIANMPTGYFEAKPRRAVGLDEVGVFVIPNNADTKLKQELLNRGYSIAEYDPNVEGDRQRVVNGFEEYKFSLSNAGESPKTYGNYNVYGKDIALESAPTVAENATVSETESVVPAPVSKMEATTEDSSTVAPVVDAENATTTIEHSVSDLAEIAKQGRRENMRGAYTHNGKQYLSDGSFIAEFNVVDDGLEQSKDFPIKQAVKELDEAFARQVGGNYDVHTSDTQGFIKVGNSLFGSKRINALIRALENPVFSLANVRGGHEALIVTADNGRAVLMPVRASGNAYLVYEAQPIADAATFPDDLAPMSEPIPGQFDTLTDADAPPEMEAPYYEDSEVTVDDPFDNRNIEDMGNRKIKAYMYENPEVKPFFQAEAQYMLRDLHDSTKGERMYIAAERPDAYGLESYGYWDGVSRSTTDDIAYLLDSCHYTYAEIEKGLNAIIEDNGKENNACSKRIEFMLNDRLLYGYNDVDGRPNPPNEDYIKLLNEKQITEYSREALEALLASGDEYAPSISEEIVEEPMVETSIGKMPLSEYRDMKAQQSGFDDYSDMRSQGVKLGNRYDTEDIAPVAKERVETPHISEPYEAIKPKRAKEPRMARATPEEQAKIAEILDEEPTPQNRKSRVWAKFKANVLDKGAVFEDLSLKRKNRELMGKWNYILSSESRAQRLMGNGASGVKSLNAIREEVDNTGKTKQFYEYLHHKHNVDRMSLAQRFENTPNKPVFGNTVTAEVSQKIVDQYETTQPKFVDYANDVYNYMNYLRKQMVDNGVISQETANLWAEMYPHYVPIRRSGDEGLNINVPLDTGRTGVNAPIKKATGGNRDILPLFDTMAMRTQQTYKAIAKNSFGVELKNTLGSTIANDATNLDEVIDSIDTQDGLLQEGKNGSKPTFTVFENGEKVTFEITEDMYDALKPVSGGMALTFKPLNFASNFHRGLLTEYNPVFMLNNMVKDAQDVLVNSQHPGKTYLKVPEAFAQLVSKGYWYNEYMDNGGEQNTYFDNQTNTFATGNKGLSRVLDMPPFSTISALNNFIEMTPRLAEYIASREAGRSVEVSMLDAARVTTNFQAGGDLTKFLNRNGATFLNASVQGAMQNIRNFREAHANGVKGYINLATKFAIAGLPAILLNNLVWDDDEEYEELSDYVKQNYYIVGKYDDGKFIRIPKGRTLAVIQNAVEQVSNAATGDDELDLATFLELAASNLAPNNPIENNILSPIVQVATNETWYGDDLVPTRLADLPAAEQFDESTDSISKWLGEKLDISPVKINYLLDQYSGGVGDVVLPMLTPEAESGDNTLLGNVIAPLKKKFTTDSVMNNQNVSDFYDTKDELASNAKKSNATDEDVLMSKYINSVNAELSDLYKQKREIQNSDLPDDEKYEAVRDVQKQIVELTKEGLDSYPNVSISDGYAEVGDRHYRKNDDGEWTKLTDKQLEKQEKVTNGLNVSAADYWSNKEEYDFAYEKPEKYAVAKSVGGYDAYRGYSSVLNDIKGVDNDGDGRSDTGTRKEKVLDWINELDADYGTKIILFKNEYNADNTYNADIVDYLNSRNDISYDEMVVILKELGFDVSSDGTVSWD